MDRTPIAHWFAPADIDATMLPADDSRARQRRDAATSWLTATVLLVAVGAYLASRGWLGSAPLPRAQSSRLVTVTVRSGDTLWAIWTRETEQRMSWRAWCAEVRRNSPIMDLRGAGYLQPGDPLIVPTLQPAEERPTRFWAGGPKSPEHPPSEEENDARTAR